VFYGVGAAALLFAVITVVLLWRFKKLQEPVIVAAAAAIGLVVYPLLRGAG
jgi:chromate transporter